MKLANPSLILQYIIHTFRNGKEAKKYNTVAMCPSDVIVDVSNREIDWPILVVSRSYRYCCFITAQNNRTKDSAVSFRVLSNQILTQ